MTPLDQAREFLDSMDSETWNQFRYHLLPLIAHAVDAAVKAEREECAKIAEEGVEWTPPPKQPIILSETCRIIARSIRARADNAGGPSATRSQPTRDRG